MSRVIRNVDGLVAGFAAQQQDNPQPPASTDAELLTLAAKAAGIADGDVFYDMDYDKEWNPLTNDEDALRLAAKLYLWEALRFAHRLVGAPGCPDIYAATRRSIVIDAAQIGKGMV